MRIPMRAGAVSVLYAVIVSACGGAGWSSWIPTDSSKRRMPSSAVSADPSSPRYVFLPPGILLSGPEPVLPDLSQSMQSAHTTSVASPGGPSDDRAIPHSDASAPARTRCRIPPRASSPVRIMRTRYSCSGTTETVTDKR